MKTTSLRARALACALLATTAYCGLAAPAAAQTARQHRALDSNGVDLTHGDFVMAFAEGSIGSGDGELALVRTRIGSGNGSWHVSSGGHQWDGLFLTRTVGSGGTTISVDKDNRFELFNSLGTLPTGSSLTASGAEHHYRTADGTLIVFGDPTGSSASSSTHCNGSSGQGSCSQLPLSISSPDGKSVSIAWEIWQSCSDEIVDENNPFPECSYWARIDSVSNSFGYRIAFTYASNGNSSLNGVPPPNTWQRRASAALYNDLVSTTTPQAGLSYSYPTTSIVEVTDMGGRVWRFSSDGLRITGIRRPGAASDTSTIAYGGSGSSVSSVTREGVTTNYSRSVSGSTATMTVTQVDPNGPDPASTIVSDLNLGRPTSVTDPTGRTTAYQYDSAARLERVTRHEGNYVDYDYDARGNVVTVTAVPKGGSGPTIVTSASFDSTCSNPATCNQPNSTTDERGNTTDYTYDSTHGGVLTATAPAPASGAVRPQTRYSYTLTNGEYRLTETSQCQTTSSCAGTADEVKSTFAYDPNGNVASTSSGDGSGALTATSAMTWDAKGDLITVDGPLSGTADTARLRYNAAREPIGSAGPDPDGAGPLKHRAVRNVIDPTTGLLTRTESGTVDSQSDAHWAAFSALQAVETGYDSHARPISQKLISGSTIHALTQMSYDSLGRPDCTAQRMNSAIFATIATGACSLGTQGTGSGDFGPDRIVRTLYDAAGRATEVKVALGTADEASEVATTYTGNGLVQTLTDGENNRTTFEYDGHDRPGKTRYPVATKGAGTSSTTDYEQTGYETFAGGARTSGLAVSFRNRAGQTIGFGHDSLGRRTSIDLPGAAVHEYDLAFAYDNLGRMTLARDLNPYHPNGVGHAFGYDALGRLTSDSHTHYGTRTFAWDLAGRRTRTTWSDGFFVDYDHDHTGAMTAIRENGATSGAGVLATFGYDDLGRRISLTRGNGTSTSYDYDGASRLTGIAADFAGTSYDQTLDFDYNPAGQIVSNGRVNHGYSFIAANAARADDHNGLNQLTQAGSIPIGHDARGNISAIGSASYAYTASNRLATAGAIELAYDALGRLYFAGGNNTAFVYDGFSIMEERAAYASGYPIVRRYVHGPGGDEPLVWYEGSGTSDRRWLHADERGSIVAVSDGSGTGLAANRYDEDGNVQGPQGAGALVGRFGYAGQPWIPELGLSYNRARFYNPALPGFMQPDPIGWAAGPNGYVYAGGDPVNATDPSGTRLCYLESDRRSGLPCGKEDADDTLEKSDSSSGTGEPKDGGGPVGELWKSLFPTLGVSKDVDTNPDSGWMSDAEAAKAGDIIITGHRDSIMAFVGDPRAPGERGATSGSGGSGDPYKNMKPHPTKPGYVIERHHQTGKKIIKRAPPGFPWERFRFFPPLFIFPPDFYNRCSMIAFPDCPKRPMA